MEDFYTNVTSKAEAAYLATAERIHYACRLAQAETWQTWVLAGLLVWYFIQAICTIEFENHYKRLVNLYSGFQSRISASYEKFKFFLPTMSLAIIGQLPGPYALMAVVIVQLATAWAAYSVFSVVPKPQVLGFLPETWIKESPFVEDEEPVAGHVAVATSSFGLRPQVAGQAVRIRDYNGMAAFATVKHVALSCGDKTYVCHLGNKAGELVKEVIYPETLPDAAILLVNKSRVSTLGGIAKISLITSSEKPAVLHCHGIVMGAVKGLNLSSRGNLLPGKLSTYVYSGSSAPGCSGSPVTVHGRVVGIHSGSLGLSSTGYQISDLQAWMDFRASKTGLKPEESWDALLRDYLGKGDDYEFSEYMESNHDSVLKIKNKRTGKVRYVGEDDVSDELLDEYRSSENYVKFQTESGLLKAKIVPENGNSGGAAQADDDGTAPSTSTTVPVQTAEMNPKAKSKPTVPVDYRQVAKAQEAMALYSAAVSTLEASTAALQYAAGVARDDVEDTVQIGADVHALAVTRQALSAVGVKMSDHLIKVVQLSAEDQTAKKRAARYRKKQNTPEPSEEVQEEIMRIIDVAQDAHNKMMEIPLRPFEVDDSKMESHTATFCDAINKRYGVAIPPQFNGSSFLDTRPTSSTMSQKDRLPMLKLPFTSSKPSEIPRDMTGPCSMTKPFESPSPITYSEEHLRLKEQPAQTSKSFYESREPCADAIELLNQQLERERNGYELSLKSLTEAMHKNLEAQLSPVINITLPKTNNPSNNNNKGKKKIPPAAQPQQPWAAQQPRAQPQAQKPQQQQQGSAPQGVAPTPGK